MARDAASGNGGATSAGGTPGAPQRDASTGGRGGGVSTGGRGIGVSTGGRGIGATDSGSRDSGSTSMPSSGGRSDASSPVGPVKDAAADDAGIALCHESYSPRPECPSDAIVNCCDCMCAACAAVSLTCAGDIQCNDLLHCAILAHCPSIEACNQPETCKLIIDDLGGLEYVAVQRAAAVLRCATHAGCDPCNPVH